tara:strand:- start:1368 stop:1721 length:354 start_codon:yes stop_codon:yes gene_type:complete
MKGYEVVGHSYNNSIFCADCSAYDADDMEHDPEDENGNSIHAILASSDDANSTCDDCGCVLLTGELPKKNLCGHDKFTFARAEQLTPNVGLHFSCSSCGVSGSMTVNRLDINWPEED